MARYQIAQSINANPWNLKAISYSIQVVNGFIYRFKFQNSFDGGEYKTAILKNNAGISLYQSPVRIS
ncbi:hypothetical protein GJ496_009310 [Pomphorhynchus laevis]|nr:hypothetical protein GJ496_009310 [Pomphorhynchus laevis]